MSGKPGLAPIGSGAAIAAIELITAQYPEGPTVHVVEVISAVSRREVHRFESHTADSDVLRVEFAEPITDAVSVRITTLESRSWVSWREVRVLVAR